MFDLIGEFASRIVDTGSDFWDQATLNIAIECGIPAKNNLYDDKFIFHNDPSINELIRDCSLFIGSTGPVFRGTGQRLFLMLPSMGHKDFLCFYGTGHELFLEKISQIIFV